MGAGRRLRPDTMSGQARPATPQTAREMLALAREYLQRRGLEEARLEAELLVAHALGIDRLGLFLRLDAPLQAEEVDLARALLLRRAAREPVAYIIGSREFYGRDFAVGTGALIPRPDTELIVDRAREFWKQRLAQSALASAPELEPGLVARGESAPSEPVEEARLEQAGAVALDDAPLELELELELERDDRGAESSRVAAPVPAVEVPGPASPPPVGPVVVDIGCGSGCIAVTLALEIPGARVLATDVSAEALAWARRNAESLGASVEWLQGDGPEALAAQARFDLIVSNPPYIDPRERAKLQPDVRDFEPALALFAPAGDPDHWLLRLLQAAGPRLLPHGRLLVELGHDQAPRAMRAAAQAGFRARLHKDLAGIERVLEAWTD